VRDERALENLSASTLRRHLKGRRFQQTHRHGKYLFVKTDDEEHLVLHFGMTGNLKYFEKDEEEHEHDRVRFDFTNGYHLAYLSQRLLGEVSLTEDVEAFVEAHELGPDALAIGADAFEEALAGRRGGVKSFLMNQEAMAGIGNECSDDILFRARLHPATPAAALDRKRRRKLYRTMRQTLEKLVKVRRANDPVPKNFLIQRRGEDAECPRGCGPLSKETIAGRSSYFCPTCQELLE
jgi:formamidopyrimidine-DNA glycosylase